MGVHGFSANANVQVERITRLGVADAIDRDGQTCARKAFAGYGTELCLGLAANAISHLMSNLFVGVREPEHCPRYSGGVDAQDPLHPSNLHS